MRCNFPGLNNKGKSSLSGLCNNKGLHQATSWYQPKNSSQKSVVKEGIIKGIQQLMTGCEQRAWDNFSIKTFSTPKCPVEKQTMNGQKKGQIRQKDRPLMVIEKYLRLGLEKRQLEARVGKEAQKQATNAFDLLGERNLHSTFRKKKEKKKWQRKL